MNRRLGRRYVVWTLCVGALLGRPLHAQQNVEVGMSAAFSGPSRGLGIELYRGSMAYLEHVNRNGGVGGRLIRIRPYDDGYNPTEAIWNTIRLIEEDSVLLLFGYVGTPTVTRVLPLLKRFSDRNIHLLFPFTGAQPQREYPYQQYVFNLRASYREETRDLVEHFVSIGRSRIAVFFQADSYGRSGWDGVKRALAHHGLEMAGEATYRRGTPFSDSLTAQVEILRREDPDAIISVGAYAACAAFIRDARDAGWEVPISNLSFVGSENLVGLLQRSETESGRSYLHNLVNSQVVPSYEDTALPAAVQYRELMDRYQPLPPADLLKDEYTPLGYSFVSFEGFLNAKVLVELLRQMSDPRDRKGILAAMERMAGLDIGIGVPVTFGPERHQGLNTVYFTTVENGRVVPLTGWSRWQK